MLPHERLPYSPIVERKPLRFPDGVRLVVWPVMSLEVWDIARPMARIVITPPQGQPLQPDHPNWSWHEYGMRVGFWRLKAALEALKLTPTVTINGRTCEVYPQVVEACLRNNWEINAHSYEQIPMHKIDDQRAVIAKTMETIEGFTGRRPRGWFGPGLTQTLDTVDHLAEAGIEYIGDWVADDDPVTLRTKHKPIVALPYSFELHDIVMMSLQSHPSDMFYNRTMDQFACLYEESKERAKIMAIAVHPYLSGAPHRIAHVRRTFEELLAMPGVVSWDGHRILDWYLRQQASATG
jgi:peptidoglycan/xylan/chitin deacetylase (PgdA/CDA1 family)